MFHNLEQYYETWKLKINIEKCETILFRSVPMYANRDTKKNYKTFAIKSTLKNNVIQNISHKNTVKYLGVNLDERLHYGNHMKIQLVKTFRTFTRLKRLFYSKHLHPEIKIICYQTLIKQLITYGSPI